MTEKVFGIYGASGFGREVMPIAQEYIHKEGIETGKLFFIDDNLTERFINGVKVVSYDEFINLPDKEKFVSLAIADRYIRRELLSKIEKDNVHPWDLCYHNVVKLCDVSIDAGSLLCPFVTLTSNIKVGKQFHANIYSYVGHDCIIGDFVTFAPSVKCNGNVVIKDNVYIGTGAIIKQGKPGRPIIIGEGAVVGMGAVVTKNVPAGVTVIGNPAKPLSRRNIK
ncbi:acetyltransferase [Endozoicomonas montiporae]|uniref:Acetyltransferase n=2 Tax=Endozoicomonas montiporae TaxID=1027273 RepID=A0A081NCB1_9GAMM|nr:NeuD/PglB/VioB family sugar acetyltransferase [Endozoicomonas montiporae]AMO56415.1 acetyl transferase protein [Endozoicomonas montiporae CL-33]KEQ16084.1 acetyltransferase [Endozoicomonas montiporae]